MISKNCSDETLNLSSLLFKASVAAGSTDQITILDQAVTIQFRSWKLREIEPESSWQKLSRELSISGPSAFPFLGVLMKRQ